MAKIMTIEDLGVRWRLTGRTIDTVEISPPKWSAVFAFYLAFYKAGAEYRAPKRDLTNEDVGVIKNLLKHYDVPSLLEWARWYWRGYAEEVYEGTNVHVLKNFRYRIPDIQRDLRPNR